MIFVHLYPSSMMMLLLVDCRRNQGPCHQVESYSLAGHSEEHMPGLVDDILGQLLAQEFDKNIQSLLQNVSNETELLCMYSASVTFVHWIVHYITQGSFLLRPPAVPLFLCWSLSCICLCFNQMSFCSCCLSF